MRNVKYYLIETFRNLVRNKLMTLTSVATVAACLLIVNFSYALASNVNFILSYIETSIGVTVFIDDELNADQIDALEQEILQLDNISGARFVSSEEALQRMIAGFEEAGVEDVGDLMDNLGPGTLRHSFELEIINIREQRQTIDELWQLHGVANVNDAEAVREALITLNNFVGILSFVIILVLGVLAVVIITNTIKLTVNSRRNEIIIMKYVGATDWFIKWPFVLEGITIGIFGAIIPLAVGWFSYDRIIGSIRNSEFALMLEIPFVSATEIFPIFAPIVLTLGAGMGVLGSITSMRKHLSV